MRPNHDWLPTLIVLILSLGLSAVARAQEEDALAGPPTNSPTTAPSKKGDQGGAIIDFEAEVIEGQRKRPDLFLQSEVQNLTLDAILYLRKDFNDFHQVERTRRPGYFERKSLDR